MSWNRKQQGLYRPLEKKAWAEHCRRNKVDLKSPTRREWYEKQLFIATGKSSTKDCNKSRDFERAMAHFAELAQDDIHWLFALNKGDMNRLTFSAHKVNPNFKFNEKWARGIARKILGSTDLPELSDLTNSQMVKVTQAVMRSAKYAKPTKL